MEYLYGHFPHWICSQQLGLSVLFVQLQVETQALWKIKQLLISKSYISPNLIQALQVKHNEENLKTKSQKVICYVVKKLITSQLDRRTYISYLRDLI